MRFISTRAKENSCSASEAIVKGISDDGGLFCPEEFPQFSLEDIKLMAEMSYAERVALILSKFMDDFSYEELLEYADNAYSRFYGDPCPIVRMIENSYLLELWHGPTCAFKDMALTLMPYLMTASRKKVGETAKTLILVATSGDTGKASLEGFKNVENTNIMVFYPNEGVSDMQRKQMSTQEGDNVYVCAINGNFDDAQNAVKSIFQDKEIIAQVEKHGYKLSSANSINWGRLAPQVAYYFSAYVDLLDNEDIKLGEKINFCVPCGNFGNILAGYYAMQCGLPINKLICASNMNNILTDFLENGEYDINRDFHKTISPSMDILISSNLERLLFDISGQDDKFITEIMSNLKTEGKYVIPAEMLDKIKAIFECGYADEKDTMESIDNCFENYDHLIDPHTGVANFVYDCYLGETGDETTTVIVSTASPYKFPTDVLQAIFAEKSVDPYKAIKKLSTYSAEEVPEPLEGLEYKEVIFTDVISKDGIKAKVVEYVASLK